jgi:Activator of Hsp90 ATPase homolog 1-like protein
LSISDSSERLSGVNTHASTIMEGALRDLCLIYFEEQKLNAFIDEALAYDIHMHGPDGTLYPITGVYQEIVEPERLVFTGAALDEKSNPLFEVRNTATFAEQGGKMTLTLQARVVKATAEPAPSPEGMEAGWT